MPSLKSKLAKAASPTRVVLASFAAGVGTMVALGLFAPILMKGGLSLTDADASPAAFNRPAIILDVGAVQAQLTEAEALMAASRVRTDRAMDRLESLSGG